MIIISLIVINHFLILDPLKRKYFEKGGEKVIGILSLPQIEATEDGLTEICFRFFPTIPGCFLHNCIYACYATSNGQIFDHWHPWKDED